MTDKKIMIDNVDVSECEHVYARTSLFKEKNFVECTAFFLENGDSRCNCTDNPNCYYKQLKRKEQECEELNEHSVGFARKCQKLELDVCHLKDKNYNLQRQLDQLKAENEKLKQTLTEINEIAERGFQHSQCNCGAKADLDLILQKICEAINE